MCSPKDRDIVHLLSAWTLQWSLMWEVIASHYPAVIIFILFQSAWTTVKASNCLLFLAISSTSIFISPKDVWLLPPTVTLRWTWLHRQNPQPCHLAVTLLASIRTLERMKRQTAGMIGIPWAWSTRMGILCKIITACQRITMDKTRRHWALRKLGLAREKQCCQWVTALTVTSVDVRSRGTIAIWFAHEKLALPCTLMNGLLDVYFDSSLRWLEALG